LAVLNPTAGRGHLTAARAALEEHLSGAGWAFQIHETRPGESIAATLREMCSPGLDLLIAAGGDGTVASVATGSIAAGLPLGIVPLGTGNALAREVGIPLPLEQALALLTGPHAIRAIDVLQVGDQCFVVGVGAGTSAWMMRDTPYEAKRRFGRLSYIWTGLRRLFGLELVWFNIEVDGQARRIKASEVNVANAGIAGDPHLRWGAHVRVDDARADVCVVRARTVADHLQLIGDALLRRQKRDPHLCFLTAEHKVTIRSKSPLPVQADGDCIGQTPVHIELLPAALQVIVPLPGEVP
jgi:YegS/Rv2252/BmrU family lipid kinase